MALILDINYLDNPYLFFYKKFFFIHIIEYNIDK